MKLWQGWHNTDLGRSYFHYGPLGGTKKQMGILAQTCKGSLSVFSFVFGEGLSGSLE